MGGLAWLNINQLGQQRELFCLTSTETRMFIRDGDKRGRRRKSEGSIAGANPEDQNAMDRRQNNRMLRQCPLRHCAATSVPRNYCPGCCAEQSHKDNVRSNSSKKLPFKTGAATGHKRPCAPKLCSLSSHCSSAASPSFCRHVPPRSHICVIIVRHRSCPPDPPPPSSFLSPFRLFLPYSARSGNPLMESGLRLWRQPQLQ